MHSIKLCPVRKSKRQSNYHNNKNNKTTGLLLTSFLVENATCSDWYIDSGCTSHMTKHKSNLFNRAEPLHKEVVVASGDKISIECVGDVSQRVLSNGEQKDIIINQVHFVPNICSNLLSVSQMAQALDNKVLFT